MKLNRKQIKESLETVPLDVVMLGAAGAKTNKLTPKQREFARQLALGESKASAYRKSRDTKAKPATASRRGQELASDSAIQAQAEAFRLAIEAQKLATPAHLRALVIQQLTSKAIDPKVQPAQQIKALELLGKITEVAAFTERREVVQVHDSQQIRERLLNSLRLAMQSSAIEVEAQASDLLAEIQSAAPALQAQPDTAAADLGADSLQSAGNPPPTDPPFFDLAGHPPLLSNPHIQSSDISATTPLTNSVPSEVTDVTNVTITPVIVRNPNEINDLTGERPLTYSDSSVVVGGVGSEISGGFKDSSPGNTPPNDLVPSGNWK